MPRPATQAQPNPHKRLLASIHDVGPGAAAQVDTLAALLEKRLGCVRFAMLVVPDHWGQHPLAVDRAYQARLRDWSDAGIEMFVHGWYHRDTAEHAGGVARFKARHMTAGEGEFLGLDQDTAAQRMHDGKSLVEDIIGRPSAGFIAPAWLYGDGARAALRQSEFALAEDHWRVWDARTEKPLAKGPVITWASRSPMRTASSIAFASLARRTLPVLPTVRIAVHPGDVTKATLLSSIEKTLACFTRTHTPSRYSDLTTNPAKSAND